MHSNPPLRKSDGGEFKGGPFSHPTMAAIPYSIYIIAHLAGAFAVAMAYGALTLWADHEKALPEGTENPYRKLGMIAHGTGMLVILVGGFGMLANLYPGESPMSLGWVHIKLTIWMLVGGGIAVLRRKPEFARYIAAAAWVLLLLAGSIGANHWDWFNA